MLLQCAVKGTALKWIESHAIRTTLQPQCFVDELDLFIETRKAAIAFFEGLIRRFYLCVASLAAPPA
jgi:hypothetical protein